jgi:hypothetical protein
MVFGLWGFFTSNKKLEFDLIFSKLSPLKRKYLELEWLVYHSPTKLYTAEECVICLDAPASFFNVECGHVTVCRTCLFKCMSENVVCKLGLGCQCSRCLKIYTALDYSWVHKIKNVGKLHECLACGTKGNKYAHITHTNTTTWLSYKPIKDARHTSYR